MITRADKGNSLVISPIKQYDSKITDFIGQITYKPQQETLPNPSSHKTERL